MHISKTIRVFIIIFLTYTIAGFILLPYILQEQVPKLIKEKINNEIAISNITFNPFTLKLELFDINIHNNKESIIYLKKASIDFSLLKSLHERHISFKEISLIEPLLNIIENRKKEINILTLLKKEQIDSSKKVNNDKNEILSFKITKTLIENAKINFSHYKNDKKETISLKQLNYTFYELGTFKNALASHSLNSIINNNTKLKVNGGFNIHPFRMYGKVDIKNFNPKEFISLSKNKLNFDISDTSINLNFGYELDLRKELKLTISDANLHINKLSTFLHKNEIITFKTFDIKNFNLEYPKEIISIDKVILDEALVNIISDKENKLNIEKLIKIENKAKELENKEEFKWQIHTREIKLLNSNINYESLKDKTSIKLNKLDIKIEYSSLNKEKELHINNITLKNKSLLLNKKEQAISLDNLAIKIDNLKSIKENILIPNISISNNLLSFNNNKNIIKAKKINISIFDTKSIKDSISIKKINVRNEKSDISIDNKRIDITNKNLNLFINNLSYKDDHFKIKSSYALKPYTKIVLNQSDEKIEKKILITKKSTNKKEDINFDIGPFKIKDAHITFEDHKLLVPFKTNITKLQGSISELSSSSSRPTQVHLHGEVDKYGYTDITGFLEYKDIKKLVNMNLVFKNLAIDHLSPYSSKFVGREILGGKLSLNLKYNIKKSNLDATNSILISKIKLGKVIESEDATSVPLDLGIALLEDSEGLIDLNLRIDGNLEDPNFSLGPIVWKVFTNLIINAVTSPFSFLASLIGLEGDELKNISFPYGQSVILPYSKEKLDSLAKIFEKRPNIILLIKASYDEKKDSYALKKENFERFLDEELKESNADDRYKEVLESLYEKEFDDIKTIRKKYIKEQELDNESYLEELKKILVLKQELPIKDLINLANKRVESIISYLNEKGIENKRLKKEDEILKVSSEDSLKQKELLINFNIDILDD